MKTNLKATQKANKTGAKGDKRHENKLRENTHIENKFKRENT